MSDTKTDSPKCPSQNELPTPRVLWTGKTEDVMNRTCRVVLTYKWHLPHKAKQWECKPEYVYEVALQTDAMFQSRYESTGKDGIPAAFFDEFIRYMDSTMMVSR